MDKVITIIGTRPEIIRTSRICPKLDESCKHIIVHTNQNFTANLKDMFFKDLRLRQPDVVFTDPVGALLNNCREDGNTGLSHGGWQP